MTHFFDFKNLPQGSSIIAEYVWIDGTGINTRSKSRTLIKPVNSIQDIPDWNYDGSSCYQASTHNSEVIIKPVAYFPDPFRPGSNNIIVLTETFLWEDDNYSSLKPTNTNFRHFTRPIFEASNFELPWFGIEQEYSLIETKNKFTMKPLGWPE